MRRFGNVSPIYTVGPLIDLKGDNETLDSDDTQKSDGIVNWLGHQQPGSSIVFLFFGTS